MSHAEYNRIGGWLLAPMAYLIVTLLSASLMLVLYAMAIITPESRDYLLTNAHAFTLQWYFSVLTTLAMWVFTLWLLWLFCHRSQRFPKLFLVWLLITVLLAIKSFAFAPIPDEVAVRSLGWPLLMAAIFAPYLRRSQRVKHTFTE
ncbi:Inner membrane protein ydgK [Serratia rubidaea]|uniref:Inner membrane protein ydgK n=1 Tax=Serratia rubidaea TaxID=61652 RepID=A0A447QU35_SERRU|nr:Inner membrane protein ydgK [Serratia rubidaea]